MWEFFVLRDDSSYRRGPWRFPDGNQQAADRSWNAYSIGFALAAVRKNVAAPAVERALEDVMNFAADKARCRDENPQALSER
ncbi:hypothetical protein, partial [Burkholderia ubonensis]|uniref:hypothetical protein n=1 Tax=Burkholderia ubonensis TaxID=101571 RepID=UPI001E2B1A40